MFVATTNRDGDRANPYAPSRAALRPTERPPGTDLAAILTTILAGGVAVVVAVLLIVFLWTAVEWIAGL